MSANDDLQNGEHDDDEVVRPPALLVKEMEEINNWARLAFQMYFGWFALQFTVNGVAMGWLFTREGPMPVFARWIFVILGLWNLMGTITTVVVRRHILDCDSRIRKVIKGLRRNHVTEDHWPTVHSPMPREAIRTVFSFCALTTFISMTFWAVLAIFPRVVGA
jgi:hypothetical protein